jgi:nicotinate-nucleotide adenylyltransferase
LSSPIGIFGGTFDPIHFGHLRPAWEMREQLGLAEVRFIPASVPPHRTTPLVTAEQRLAMLRLALQGVDGMRVDEREFLREGPSYMVDTLHSLRDELGEQPMVLLLGLDAFLGLSAWHRWQELIELAHIAVAIRPGWERSELEGEGDVARLWQARRGDGWEQLRQRPAGRVVMVEVTPLAISATAIRQQLQEGRSPRFLLPDSVLDYIEHNGLYRGT